MTTTVTVTVTPVVTVRVIVIYGAKRIAVVPMHSLTSLTNLAARLQADDLIVSNYANVADFDNFPNHPNKDILFSQADDANIAAIVAVAQSYGAGLCYDVEGITPPEIQTKLEACYAAVRAIDANIKFTFGVIYGHFLTYYDDYAPYCDSQVIQIQRAWKGTEATLTDDGITKTQSVGDGLYVQICAYTPTNPNGEEITSAYIASVYEQLRTKDIESIWLYFSVKAQEALVLGALDLIGRATP